MAQRDTIKERLEACVALHAPLVDLALEVLDDKNVAPEARVPLAAAAHYGAQEIDLIPDSYPAYGRIDDLFVLALGLERTLQAAGAAGARYRAREIGGRTLSELFTFMREQFYGFWTFCDQQTQGFFADFEAAWRRDGGVIAAARAELAAEREVIARSTSGVQLDPAHVDDFLARFRALRAEDFA